MRRYADQMADRLPPGLRLPDEFDALFDWMEAGGRFLASARFPGDQLGLLGTEAELRAGAVTAILFRVETPEHARESGDAWFGGAVPDIAERLVPFARTGGDGSHVGFWRDEEGRQQIVHLGSEGQVFLAGRTPLDFLRLLAVGYEEISGDAVDASTAPPDRERNVAFRAWLVERYGVAIPRNAAEILGRIPDAADESATDPFLRWVRQHQPW